MDTVLTTKRILNAWTRNRFSKAIHFIVRVISTLAGVFVFPVCMHVCVCVFVYVCVRVRACLRAWVCVCVHACDLV